MGTNCAQLIADLFLYCYERDFISDLQKSKRHDLIDMFNDTSRYLDDIFIIDNPEFDKYIPDIYPAELQLDKANTSDKETSFLDLNIKFIGSDIHKAAKGLGVTRSVFDRNLRALYGFLYADVDKSVWA